MYCCVGISFLSVNIKVSSVVKCLNMLISLVQWLCVCVMYMVILYCFFSFSLKAHHTTAAFDFPVLKERWLHWSLLGSLGTISYQGKCFSLRSSTLEDRLQELGPKSQSKFNLVFVLPGFTQLTIFDPGKQVSQSRLTHSVNSRGGLVRHVFLVLTNPKFMTNKIFFNIILQLQYF